MLTVLDRWLDALDSVVHAVGKKLSVLALSSMLTSNVPYVIFCYKIIHVPVDLTLLIFSGLPFLLPVVIASNCKNRTHQSMHANFISQTVLLMLGIIYLTML